MVTNNNTFATATNLGVLTGSRTRSGNLRASDRLDTYRFRLTDRRNFSSALEGLSNDAELVLFNRNRRVIARSDNSGTTSEAIETNLGTGVYFVQVRRKQSNTRYSLTLSTTANGGSNPGNTVENALVINPGGIPSTFVDSVGTGNNNDFYAFSTNTAGNLDLALGGLSTQANLQIVDRNGTTVALSNQITASRRTLNINLVPGTYFIQVSAPQNAQTNYSLTVALTPPELVGLSNNNTLFTFTPDNTDAASVAITGLGLNESLVDIDFLPATGQLYGLSNVGRLYTLNFSTGVATRVGDSTFNLAGTQFGIDFDPLTDRLRVVTNLDQNVLLNPITGDLFATGSLLNYAPTDENRGANPDVGRIAYSNTILTGTTTTLYAIDSGVNRLLTQGSPTESPTSANSGQLFTVSRLSGNLAGNGGFDIFTDLGGVDFAYATSNAGLYIINLSTGEATLRSTVNNNNSGVFVGLIGIAARPVA